MMPAKCSLCSNQMVTMPVTSPKGQAVPVSFCRKCDRRRCVACGHHEQNVFSRRCTNCNDPF